VFLHRDCKQHQDMQSRRFLAQVGLLLNEAFSAPISTPPPSPSCPLQVSAVLLALAIVAVASLAIFTQASSESTMIQAAATAIAAQGNVLVTGYLHCTVPL
jgi:hypothetical protein